MKPEAMQTLADCEQLLAELYGQLIRAGWKSDAMINRVKEQRHAARQALGLPPAELEPESPAQ